MSKAHFPHQRPSDATSGDAGRHAEPRAEYIPKAPAGDFVRPNDQAEPVRSALAELQSRLTRLPNAALGADVENTLRDLEQRFADIARRVELDASRRREGRSAPPADAIVGPPNAGVAENRRDMRGDDAAISPLLEAIAEIVRRQGALDDSHEGAALAPEPPFEALQRSIDSVARHLDSFREDVVERGDQQLVMMRQIENVRRELQDMAQAIGELAPRASVAAIETAMGDLRQRIESQRDRGIPAETLAPAERLIGELRAVIEDLDPTPIVRNLRADVETIGIRLEKLQTGDVAQASAVQDLARETHEIKEQLTTLAARPLPLEKIEARLIDVTQRIDGLRSRDPSGADLGEVVTAIRSIVAAETGKGLETFNRQLERLAQKLDLVAEQSAAARFDAIGERIDELGKTLTQRIDQGTATTAPLEALIATLAQKIDAALDNKSPASAFEEIGRRFDLLESRVVENAPSESLARIEAMLAEPTAERLFADLAQRIEQLRETIAARIENAANPGGAGQVAAIEELARGLNRKIDAALAADARQLDLRAVERELAQLSFKIDRLDDPFSAPRFGDQNSRLDEISERLDRMHAAFAQRADDGARVENRERELAALVQSLAERITKSADPAADGGGLKSLETQIGALAQRLERIDAGNDGLIGLESKINDLFARLDDTRSATTQAAEAAVRKAVADILREAASVQPDAPRPARQREWNDLRAAQDASGQRMKESSTADDARERVYHRLSVFEDELNKMRRVARDVRGADADGPVAGLAASPEDAESDEFAPVDPMEFLLPVGDSAADRRESFVAPPMEEAEHISHRSSIQWDFINAARRAARAPAAEAGADARSGGDVGNAGKAEVKAPGGAVVELSAVLKERKRPLLLGVGALILLIGAYHFARLEMQGGTFAPVLKRQEAKAPAPAARPVGSREQPLAGKSVASLEVAKPPAAPGLTRRASPSAGGASGAGQSGLAPSAQRPIAARRNIDPMPTGAIETAPLSSGDALAAIQRLAVQGDPAAQYEMAARLVDGRGAARDAKAAARWFEKAAEAGLAPAQYRLGSLYEKGIGVARDYARARLWYERAAQSGNARAMHNFAVLLAEGGDGKPDYAAAAEWFRRAAEYGVRDSQFNLAILYARGLGVDRNLPRSYAWFSAAADQGDADAAGKRDEIGARLDSKELAAAKALAAAFRAKAPAPEANDAPALRTGAGEGTRERTPVKPATKAPSGKPKVSQL